MSRFSSLSSTSRIFVMWDLACGYVPGWTGEPVPHNHSAADIHGGKRDGERGPLAEGALDRDLPSHHLTDVLADRQPEARAAVFAGGQGIRLVERLEQLPHLLGGHADAGVGHTEPNPGRAVH